MAIPEPLVTAPSRPGLIARAVAFYARRRYGDDVDPANAYMHSPLLGLGYGAFETAFEQAGAVDPKLMMLAELKASAVVTCEWCMDFGSHLARKGGVPEEQLLELARHRESDAFDETEKLVLDFATAISRTPAEVDDELAARMKAAFSPKQIVELAMAAGIENLRARVNQGLRIAPQGFSEGAVCIVPEEREAAASEPIG